MKTSALLIALLVISGATLFFQQNSQTTEQGQVFSQYQSWKSTHGLNYGLSEDALRFQIFYENYLYVQQFNAENNFTLGVKNQFAALTNEEFRAIYTSETIRSTSNNQKSAPIQAVSAYPTASVNWVNKGALVSVQNQGQCGSCWAFSAVCSLESLYFINSGNLVDFSEQQVVSCDSISYGCDGGWPESAFYYASQNGLTTASNYPYVQLNNASTASCNTASIQNPTKVNTGYQSVAANTPASMVSALQNQPISVLVDGGSLVFQLYNGGIIDSTSCGTSLDHAINAVAYDGNGVWTLRNSWGSSWGESGYARVQYVDGAGYCGMNKSPSYPTQ